LILRAGSFRWIGARLGASESTQGANNSQDSRAEACAPTFRVNIWDFGGQQIYHATHQFFLTKRSKKWISPLKFRPNINATA
jgi:hypothetical protein